MAPEKWTIREFNKVNTIVPLFRSTKKHNIQMHPRDKEREQCFSEASTWRPADLLSSFTTIKTVMTNLYDGLAQVLLVLLENADTRENVLEYLAEVINKNSSRAHIQVDPLSCASSGMFVNLSVVMLRLCKPFSDANLTKRDKIDPKYVFYSNRLELRGLAALHASSEEVTEWINKDNMGNPDGSRRNGDGENRLLQSQEATSSGNSFNVNPSNAKAKYSFICECFFMTARDGTLIQSALSFYRLMVVWLVRLVGGFKMPLPSTCPTEFADSMPEHFVEDAMELLIFASRIPKALDGVLLVGLLHLSKNIPIILKNWARIEGNHHSGALLMLDIVGSVQPLIGILYLFLHLKLWCMLY